MARTTDDLQSGQCAGATRFAEPAEFRVPWIVAVDYELAISNTGGEWGTRSYVALFGYQILLRKTVGMQS